MLEERTKKRDVSTGRLSPCLQRQSRAGHKYHRLISLFSFLSLALTCRRLPILLSFFLVFFFLSFFFYSCCTKRKRPGSLLSAAPPHHHRSSLSSV